MLLLVLLLAVAAIPILARMGVFRASNIVGPERLNPGESALNLVVLLAIAFFLFFCVSVAYVWIFHTGNPLIDSAVLDGTGLLILLGLNANFRQSAMQRLGLTWENLRRALLLAPAAAGLLFPSVMILSTIVFLILQHFHKEIPMHPFLKLIQESHDPKMIALLYLSAAVIAPVAEELVFRAHVQTILTWLFTGFRKRTPIAAAAALQPSDSVLPGPDGLPILNYATPAVDDLPRTSRARWLSVIVASILFALVHQQVEFLPPLFLLAMGLGYTYERTGNLWACIGIHGLFNAFEVTMFLWQR